MYHRWFIYFFKLNFTIQKNKKLKILIAFKEELLKNNFTIKIFTENNFFNKTIDIGKTFKSSKIKHLEINGNLLSIFVFLRSPHKVVTSDGYKPRFLSDCLQRSRYLLL